MPAATPKIAIVSTVRSANAGLDEFLAWHRAIGVKRFYIFVSQVDDPGCQRVSRYSDVALWRRDAALERQWRACPSYYRFAQFLGSEVMARQVLNVEVALRRAADDGMDWLIHIDVDEMLAPRIPLNEVFAAAPPEVGSLVFKNLEAVPEAFEPEGGYRSITLFKKPMEDLTPSQTALVAPLLSAGRYYLAYTNGKAAARVAPGTTPNGVHRFTCPFGHPTEAPAADVALLHFFTCGFREFRAKFDDLADFPDTWFDTVPVFEFYKAARDVNRTKDEAAIERFYRRVVMLEDEREKLAEAGILLREAAHAWPTSRR